MARIRTIKPEFWTSEQVMECRPLARLLFIGIWNFCDDGGNHPASEKTIKAQVFPGDDIDSTSVRLLLDELSNNDLLSFYDHSGKTYLHVNGWRHQKIDKPTIKFPAFANSEASASRRTSKAVSSEAVKPGLSGDFISDQSSPTHVAVGDNSSSASVALTPGREGEGIGKGEEINQEHVLQGSASEDVPLENDLEEPEAKSPFDPDQPALPNVEPGAKPTRMRKPDPLDGFDQFYRMYPRKHKRADAEKAWGKLAPNSELQTTMVIALGHHCLQPEWRKDGGQFIPLPASWINGRRWEDELTPATASKASAYTNLPTHTPDMYQGGANGPAF
ncbi:hypothetical protein [Pseudomonas fluorescens]|uniref:DnaT DNA-binding domain-containing protein n=1 Tax=Pseudomonas fluorescens TaxID=294 RepID=A0A5E7E8D8_PSEFL|nr:hypothetical protein [Pseudomonas fluorescens]VVO22968.1 hypothetical protein PS723_04365 [Pseudomonas fluorescens]